MKRYYKEENGTRIWFKNILKVDGVQIINPSEEQLSAAGYVLYVPPAKAGPTETELLAGAIKEQVRKLHDYDGSNAVNVCYIRYAGQTVGYWADKHERDALKSAVRDYISLGRTEYRLDLRDKGFSITIPCEDLLRMLAALEVYATECYNRTTDHEFAIKALATKEEVYVYDFYGAGYPERLTFDLGGDGAAGDEAVEKEEAVDNA